MRSCRELHLIDYLALRLNCIYISDLLFLDALGRMRLRWVLAGILPNAFPLREWLAAMLYLSGQPAAEASPERVREELLQFVIGNVLSE